MATLQILESDYDSAKKKNNKIKMKAISNIIRDSKSFSRNPNEALIDTVVIRYIKKIKLEISQCPKSRLKTKNDLYEELKYVSKYAPILITNKEAIKSGIIQIAKKYNLKLIEENKYTLNKLIFELLYMRVDMRVASIALNELVGDKKYD